MRNNTLNGLPATRFPVLQKLRRPIINLRVGLVLLAVSYLAIAANAQLVLQLNPAGQTGEPGDAVTYNATLTNNGTTTVFLNGIGFNNLQNLIVPDDSLFFDDWPISLAPGDSITADLFQVALDPSVAYGDYAGSVTISGGADGFASDPVASSDFQVSVGACTVSGTVTLQDYAAAAVAGTPVTMEIRLPGTTTVVDSQTLTLEAGGSFSFTAHCQTGTYDIAMKASHWLRKKVPNVNLSTAGLTGLTISLVNGDINGDNRINLADFAQLRTAFGSAPGGSNWNQNADLNGDGHVNLGDFAILRTNFGLIGDP